MDVLSGVQPKGNDFSKYYIFERSFSLESKKYKYFFSTSSFFHWQILLKFNIETKFVLNLLGQGPYQENKGNTYILFH